MLHEIKTSDEFLNRARYPKGKATLRSIHKATYELIVEGGLSAASQDAIAKQANVSQSAVRHYFPTKEELLLAFFSTGVERLRSLLDEKLADNGKSAKDKLLEIVSTHYDWINSVEDVYYFESAAFWGRNPGFRSMREKWYRNMSRQYRILIQGINPSWDQQQCEDASFQLMTLILGGWTTMGNTRAVHRNRSKKALKNTLLAGVHKLIS